MKPKIASLVLLLAVLNDWHCSELDVPSSSGVDRNIDAEFGQFVDGLAFHLSNEIESRGRVTIGFKHAEYSASQNGNEQLLRDSVNLLVRFVYQALSGNRSAEKRKQVSIPLENVAETKVKLELIRPNSEVKVYYRIVKNGFVGIEGFREITMPIRYQKTSVNTFARLTSLKVNPKVRGLNFVALKLAFKLDEVDESCQEYDVTAQIVYPQLKLSDPVNNKVFRLFKSEAYEERSMELYVIPCTLGQIVLSTTCSKSADGRKLAGQKFAETFELDAKTLLKINKDAFEFSTMKSKKGHFLTIHHPNFYGPSCTNFKATITYESSNSFERDLDDIHLTGRQTHFKIQNDLKDVQTVQIEIENPRTGETTQYVAKKRRTTLEPEIDSFLGKEDVLSLINGFEVKLSSEPQISTDIRISESEPIQTELDDQYFESIERRRVEENGDGGVNIAKNLANTSRSGLSIVLMVFGAIILISMSVFLFMRFNNKKPANISSSKKPPHDKMSKVVPEIDNKPNDAAVDPASVKFMENSQANALDDIRRLRMEDAMKKKKSSQKQKLNSYAKSAQILSGLKIDGEITAESAPKCDSLMKSEYEAIQTFRFDKIFSKDANLLPHNSSKIRAKENFCYDHSRVELKNGDGDFIHANFVPDCRGKERFIVTQAPLPQTNVDFWTMVYEQNACLVISILTEQEECQCKLSYIPEIANRPFRYGKIEVVRGEFKEEISFTSAQLHLRNLTTGDEIKLTCLKIRNWPDHMHPKHACLISPATQRIEMILGDESNKNRPAISHCMAGIGRSASMFAINCLMDEISEQGKCNPAAYVLFANQYRHKFAMSYEPYCFIQQFIQNHLAGRKFAFSNWNDLVKYDWENLDVNSQNLQAIYNFVSIIDPELSEGGETKRERVKRNAPYSSYAFAVNTLLSQNQTNGDFINASYIPGLEPNEYIVTQNPLESTVKDFWNMVLCHKLRYIILLGQNASFIPDDESNGIILTDYARIDLISVTRQENGTVYKCKIASNAEYNTNHHGNRIEFEVSVIVAEAWTLESCMSKNGMEMMAQFLKCWKLSFKNYHKTPLLIVDELGSTMAIQIPLILTLIRVKKQVGTNVQSLAFDLVNYLQILSLHRPGCLGSVEDFGKLLSSAGYYVTNAL